MEEEGEGHGALLCDADGMVVSGIESLTESLTAHLRQLSQLRWHLTRDLVRLGLQNGSQGRDLANFCRDAATDLIALEDPLVGEAREAA